MNAPDPNRLEWLLAGRALGALSPDEERELARFLEESPEEDLSWELTVAALEVAFWAKHLEEPLPLDVRRRLERSIGDR